MNTQSLATKFGNKSPRRIEKSRWTHLFRLSWTIPNTVVCLSGQGAANSGARIELDLLRELIPVHLAVVGLGLFEGCYRFCHSGDRG